MKIKLNINIEQIEFEASNSDEQEYSFHNQIHIKKSLERELTRLFLDTATNNKNSLIESLLRKGVFSEPEISENIFFREIEGAEFSLTIKDKNPSLVGKKLAKSIYSSLIPVDSDARSSSIGRNKSIMN